MNIGGVVIGVEIDQIKIIEFRYPSKLLLIWHCSYSLYISITDDAAQLFILPCK